MNPEKPELFSQPCEQHHENHQASRSAFTAEFLQARSYLRRLAYNILGVWQEAEDIVQDVFASVWTMKTLPEFVSIQAYCTKAVVNRALNRKTIMQREIAASYWGIWLPEPSVSLADASIVHPSFSLNASTGEHSEGTTSADEYSFSGEVRFGLLKLMEILSPQERVVYVLREIFEESYKTIADLLEVSEPTARKNMERATKKLAAGKQRFSASKERHLELFQAFVQASQEGNTEALYALLKEDAVMYSDGGGKAIAARIPVRGREKILTALRNISQWSQQHEPAEWFPCLVNEHMGAFALHQHTKEIITVMTLEADEYGITELYSVRNPDKLQRLRHIKEMRNTN